MKNTMKYLKILIVIAASNFALNPVFANTFDGSETLLCSIHSILECGDDYQCKQVTPQSVNLVNFFEVSVADKEIRAAGLAREGAKTTIERVEHVGGKLLMQGGDLHEDDGHEGIGWSIIISEADGKFSMSGISNSFALVGFGACLVP